MSETSIRRLTDVLKGTSDYERLDELIPGMIYIYDLVERRNIFSNRSMAELLGYSPDEVARLGDRLLATVVHPEDLSLVVEHHRRQREARGDQIVEIEFRVLDRVGEPRWLHCWENVLLREPDGTPRRVLGLAQEVTRRVQAEQELRESRGKLAESEQRWRSIAENPFDFVVVIDREYKYTYVNFTIPGLQVDDLVGQKGPCDFVSPRDRHAMIEAFEYVFSQGRPTSYEVYVESLDSWYSNLAGPIREGDAVTHISILTRDISAEKRAQAQAKESEQQLRRMEAKLAQAAKLEAVGQLAGGIAHDFNNLLTGISGVVEILSSRLENDPCSEDVLELREAVQRGTALTRQLLAFSRQQAISPTLLELNALLEASSRLLRRLIGADIELVLSPGEVTLCVRADANQLEQVLMNLAVNARDAMPGGGTLKLELSRVRLDEHARTVHPEARPGEYARVTVSDTGQGMDEATVARIFEPFFTTKPPGAGTGLGLAMVHGIVSKAGGFVEVRSEPAKGTTFDVWLPVAHGQPLPAHVASDARPRGREIVLLVEDEEHVQRTTTHLLERLGYRVITASRGEEALASVQAGAQFDVLLTDVLLPGMDGQDLFRRLIALRGSTPVVFMSGYTDNVLVEKGLNDARAVFLAKPFSWNELAVKVRAALDAQQDSRLGRVLD